MKKGTRSTAFNDALAQVRKKQGLAIGSLDEVLEDVEGISTGNLALDYITGCWGLPTGRIVELYGLQSPRARPPRRSRLRPRPSRPG